VTAEDDPILIGLGANLPGPDHRSPRETLEAALEAFPSYGLRVVRRSPWYESSPVPPSDQPWFVNGVAVIETDLSPQQALAQLLAVEQAFGRQRGERWAARTLDLDLLAYGARVVDEPATAEHPAAHVPHPRLQDRRFVLLPLKDVAPNWRHPRTGEGIDALIEALTDPGEVRLLNEAKS
jgi:2-amino-4-hydroxy-6-hydroxymethyldihydropteridine diphosphokinase